jgi:branched-chain amino acid transport system substrate-binding protein
VEPVSERYWIFKTPQTDVLAVNELIDYMNGQGFSNVALITDSGGFGSTGRDVLVSALPVAGFNIVADEKFDTADTDMTTQLTKISGTDAEAIICWGTNPGPALVAKNMKQLSIETPLLMSHGIANKKFIELGGDATNEVIFPAGKMLVAAQLEDGDPQKQLLLDYIADFEAAYGEGTANTFGGHAYDALSMVVAALDEVGPDSAKIRDYLENDVKEFAGTGGIFNMSTSDHNGLTKGAFVLVEIVDGEWTWLR